MERKAQDTLRRGWTTGACAAAAAKAAYAALLGRPFPDPVTVRLPGGETPAFALALEGRSDGYAQAGVVKDAGDDPDVTHGALVVTTVRLGPEGQGLRFAAGEGVGTVTKAGLPLAVGEPAINPAPRRLIETALRDIEPSAALDLLVEVSVPGGKPLAAKTWNPRLGIEGGLSILGTSGIVRPFSCSAWIHSIHRGIDVARANGLDHVAGATGATSEKAAQAMLGLPTLALIDMGDFAGGLLKYLRAHPVPRVTLAGGFAKLTKLGQGYLDLHSGRSQVDFDWLADQLEHLGAPAATMKAAKGAASAGQVLAMAAEQGLPLGDAVAAAAQATSVAALDAAPVAVDVLVFDRAGGLVGRAQG